MTTLSLTRLAVAVSGLTLALTAGVGVAAADPDLGPAVNTTCTYDQLVAALNAQDPTIAAFFNSSPQMQSGLRDFLAAPPDRRRQIAHDIVNGPHAGPYIPVLQRTFATCNNF